MIVPDKISTVCTSYLTRVIYKEIFYSRGFLTGVIKPVDSAMRALKNVEVATDGDSLKHTRLGTLTVTDKYQSTISTHLYNVISYCL